MRSKEDIDYTNKLRKDAGQEPLPYEVENSSDNSDDEAAKKEIEDKKKLEAESNATDDEKKKAAEAEAEKNRNQPVELTDDEIEAKALALLEKRGKKVTSLNDLINPPKELTPEEIQKQKDQAEADKASFIMKHVSKKVYDGYVNDVNNLDKVVYADFEKDEKEENPNITDEEIKEKFNAEFGIEDKPESIEFKRGKKKLEIIAEKLLNEKYKNISEADKKYLAHMASEKEKSEYQSTITAKAPQYKKDIDEAIASIGKVKIPMGEKQFVEIEVSPEVIESVRKDFENPERAASKIASNYTKERLEKEVEAVAVMRDLPKILKRYADSELLKHQAGLRGVVPSKTGEERRHASKAQATENGFDPYAYTGAPRPVEN